MRWMTLRRTAPALMACLGMTGCATPMEVRPLATGRSDVAAYELTGADLGVLRSEARRLCPQGGEVLRQSGQPSMRVESAGSLRGAMDRATAWADPPPPSAQLMVVCREVVGQGLL